ncbi:DUF3458 domain-containing protein, partial [Proteus mirabilis]
VRSLLSHRSFTLANPNRTRALITRHAFSLGD